MQLYTSEYLICSCQIKSVFLEKLLVPVQKERKHNDICFSSQKKGPGTFDADLWKDSPSVSILAGFEN